MNMILITLSMFLAVVIIQTHIRGDRKNKVPPWLRRVSYTLLSLGLVKIKITLIVNNFLQGTACGNQTKKIYRACIAHPDVKTSQLGIRLDSRGRKEKTGKAKADMAGYICRGYVRDGCQWQWHS